jgi:hypothetical protein
VIVPINPELHGEALGFITLPFVFSKVLVYDSVN